MGRYHKTVEYNPKYMQQMHDLSVLNKKIDHARRRVVSAHPQSVERRHSVPRISLRRFFSSRAPSEAPRTTQAPLESALARLQSRHLLTEMMKYHGFRVNTANISTLALFRLAEKTIPENLGVLSLTSSDLMNLRVARVTELSRRFDGYKKNRDYVLDLDREDARLGRRREKDDYFFRGTFDSKLPLPAAALKSEGIRTLGLPQEKRPPFEQPAIHVKGFASQYGAKGIYPMPTDDHQVSSVYYSRLDNARRKATYTPQEARQQMRVRANGQTVHSYA